MFKIFLLIMVLALIVLLVCNTIYALKRTRWPELQATLNGRSGVVVSHWPFDLRVTINTSALDGSDQRDWITDWRWKFTFDKKKKVICG